MKNNSYILKGGRVVDPGRDIDQIMDIAFSDGKIVNPEQLKNPEIIDCSGCVISPGFIDIHVHLRQPGNNAAETIATGTLAAAAGGFTSIVAMPNTNPPADTPGSIELINKIARLEGVVRVLPCGCLTKGREGKEMAGIGGLHGAGVVALSDDGNGVQDHFLMRHIAEYANSFNLPILDHCEDVNLMAKGVMHEGEWSVRLGIEGIPSVSEALMVARDALLAELTGASFHVQHISARESIDILRVARKNNIPISGEVTPHHIALTDECIKTYNTNYKMNPPLRSENDRKALIEALVDGTITVIATDHAPHTATSKQTEFDYAPFGIIGLETALPVCLTILYHDKHLSMKDFVAKLTTGPAEVLKIKNYSLAEGNVADITIFDPEKEYTIDSANFFSKSKNSPFIGMNVKGQVRYTIVDGKIVYRDNR